MPGRDGFRLYVLTCAPRIMSGVVHGTLASIARSDWGDEPVVHLDDEPGGGDAKTRQTRGYRRVLERIARERLARALVLEDDVAVNRHLRANLEAWEPVRRGDPFLGSLYNPNLRPLAGAPAVEHGFVADPESVYGSQAFVLTPEVADYCLEHWDEVQALQDIRVSRLAARMDPRAVHVHTPSLVEHVGAALSTHGGSHHTATDFDPWWHAGANGAHPLPWEQVHGWFDWPRFYQERVNALPHGAMVVEVGVFLGRSIIYLAQAMKAARKDLQLYAVDTFAGSPSDPVVLAAVEAHGGSLRAAFERNLADAGVAGMVTVIPATSVQAARAFADGGVDLVFLDGDHAYDAVVADLLAWLPRVRRGGMLAGHDIDTYADVSRALDGVLGRGRYAADHAQNLWTYRKG
jgi:predicted O-methyltransferase YrrM